MPSCSSTKQAVGYSERFGDDRLILENLDTLLMARFEPLALDVL